MYYLFTFYRATVCNSSMLSKNAYGILSMKLKGVKCPSAEWSKFHKIPLGRRISVTVLYVDPKHFSPSLSRRREGMYYASPLVESLQMYYSSNPYMEALYV